MKPKTRKVFKTFRVFFEFTTGLQLLAQVGQVFFDRLDFGF